MNLQDPPGSRSETAIEALNARIARLAMALDVSLDSASAVQALMDQAPPSPPFTPERRRDDDGQHRAFRALNGERRKAHLMEELRGLLVLRYHFETTVLQDSGLEVTREILEQAHAHLLQRGFKQGADGLGLEQFLPRN